MAGRHMIHRQMAGRHIASFSNLRPHILRNGFPDIIILVSIPLPRVQNSAYHQSSFSLDGISLDHICQGQSTWFLTKMAQGRWELIRLRMPLSLPVKEPTSRGRTELGLHSISPVRVLLLCPEGLRHPSSQFRLHGGRYAPQCVPKLNKSFGSLVWTSSSFEVRFHVRLSTSKANSVKGSNARTHTPAHMSRKHLRLFEGLAVDWYQGMMDERSHPWSYTYRQPRFYSSSCRCRILMWLWTSYRHIGILLALTAIFVKQPRGENFFKRNIWWYLI